MTIRVNRCVLTPVNLNKWAVVFLEANRNAVQKFCTTMASQGKEYLFLKKKKRAP